MTQISMQYACSPATGDYGPLTVENLAMARLLFGGFSLTDGGVIYWLDPNYVFQVTTTGNPSGLSNAVDGLLEPTEAGGVVTIDTGTAIVNGYLYFSDETEDFDIDGNPGNANATDIIALRWTAASQSVRLTRIAGAAASTAVLTQTTTTWDIPIAEVALDGSGQFSALTDVRRYAQTTLFPPTRTVRRFVQTTVGTNGPTELGAGYNGYPLPDAANEAAAAQFIVPSDYVSGMTIEAVVISPSSGNAVVTLAVGGGQCGEGISTNSFSEGPNTEAITLDTITCIFSLDITGVTRGDILWASILRTGTDGSDTLADDLYSVGFTYEYQGYDGVFPT